MNKGSIVEAVLQRLIALGRVAKNRYINYLLYFTFPRIQIYNLGSGNVNTETHLPTQITLLSGEHLKLPGVLMHLAWAPQPPLFVAHSLISASIDENTMYLYSYPINQSFIIIIIIIIIIIT